MRLEKEFEVDRSRESVVEIVASEDTLAGFFPDSETEIVSRKGNRTTTRTHYVAMGRPGTATFHFTYLSDGDVEFEKVCDGKVWRELRGTLSFGEIGSRTQIRIAMEGRTQALIPEFTIKGAMRDQISQIARALDERLRP
jgi:hypothetical protein